MSTRKGIGAEPEPALYLLRVWPARGQGGVALRAALKSHHDGEWVGFASLEAMVAALRAALAAQQEEEAGPMTNE